MNTTERSRFYHYVFDRAWKRGRRTSLSSAGFVVEARGWDVGVEIHGTPDLDHPGRDTLTVFVTQGSNHRGEPGKQLFTLKQTGDGVFIAWPDGLTEEVKF